MKSPQSSKESKPNEKISGGPEEFEKSGPKSSIIKMGKKCKVSHRTISGAALEMQSYVRRRRNLFTARSRAVGVEKNPMLLNHLRNKRGNFCIFVDEKIFIVN